MTHGRLGLGLVGWLLLAAWGSSTAGCGRPMGTVIDGEQPDGSVPADVAPPPPPPCMDLAGLHAAGPWPTFRRCQSRAGCSPNLGPASATVAWSEPIDTELLGVAIGSDGRIYGPSTDYRLASARDPDTGEELVSFGSLDGPGYRGFPTLGPGGDLWLQDRWGIRLFEPDGSEGLDLGASNPGVAGSPLARGTYLSQVMGGGLHYGDAELLTIDRLDPHYTESVRVPLEVSTASGFPSLVAETVLIVGRRRTEPDQLWVWKLIAIDGESRTELLSGGELLHDVVVGDGVGRTYLVADDASGTGSRLIGLDRSFAVVLEVGGLAPLGIAPTLGPDNAVHVVAGGADPPWTLRCLERDGAVRWEAPLPGLPLAHPVADGDGTVYVGGEGYLVAIDAEGQARWILEETDEELSVQSLALGADRRLIVQTLTRLLSVGP